MIVNSSQDKTSGLGVGKSMAAVQTQVSIMLNMVVATLTAYGIGYYFAGYFTPSTSHVSYPIERIIYCS